MSESPSQPPCGLARFDLPTVFRCAVELAEATAALPEAEWADLPADCTGPASPFYARQVEESRRRQRIEDETVRLKRAMGATGPLRLIDCGEGAGPTWVDYDQEFNNAVHDRIVRLALMKLATAAIDLSGFATWRECQWHLRETGLRLLAWGLAQLWEGMTSNERSGVQDRLRRTHRAVGWPADDASEPSPYDGPDEIPPPDQSRLVQHYIACTYDHLDKAQAADNARLEEWQETYLRGATPSRFVETAERAARAVQALLQGQCGTQAEWFDLYNKSIYPLACLRRAREIPPREVWPPSAIDHRGVLADAASILLTSVGGTPEAKAGLKPQDADRAFEAFNDAIAKIREAAEREIVDRLIAGPDDAALSARELAVLEAHLSQTGPCATIRQVGKPATHSSTEAARSKLRRILDYNHKSQGQGEGKAPETQNAPAKAPRRKRSTERGEAQEKLIAALTKHHGYADGGCLNQAPIGNNALARLAEVSNHAASAFFAKQFKGHKKYRAICSDRSRLIAALKMLNGDFAPHLLCGDASLEKSDRDGFGDDE